MNTFKDEETVFAAALRLPLPERRAFLDRACGADGPLRQRLEALLKSYAASEQVLEKLAAPDLDKALAGSIPPNEQPGGSIGRYKLLQQIGEGGCGVVYMAEQEEPVRRRVALKIIKLGMDTKQVIARFEAERQALALMDHPNIAKVLDAGATETGRPYFVMELVRGVKITQYCDHNNLPIKDRLELFVQVCRAIQHAHQKGIIHRDIKPSNILVTLHDGVAVPKVIDFGIAKATQGRLTDMTLFTAFDQFMGTPAYTSPEQAEISGLDIDTRSDIYSLGVLLYELLTGKTPFDTQHLLAVGLDEVRRTIREQEPQRPSTKLSTMLEGELTATAKQHDTDALKLVIAIRGDLDWIVMKCLEKDRSRRYDSANDLARDIERHLAHEAVMACPPSKTYQVRKFVRRNKIGVAAVGGVAIALLGGIGVAGWQFWEKNLAYEKVVAAEREQRRLRIQAQEAEAAERENLYRSYIAQIRAGRFSRDAGQRRFGGLELVKKAAKIRPSLELRNEAIACLAMPDMRLMKERRNLQSVSWPSIGFFKENIPCYVVGDEQGNMRIRDFENERELALLAGGGARPLLAGLSPDARMLYVDDDYSPRIWDIESNQMLLTAPIKRSRCLTFSADCKRIAIAQRETGPVLVHELPSGKQLGSFPVEQLPWDLALDPQGRRLAVSSDRSREVLLFDIATGTLAGKLPHPSIVHGVSFSPDGEILACCADTRVHLWDVSTTQELAQLSGHEATVLHSAFSHGGRLLATTSWDGNIKLWSLATLKELCSGAMAGYSVRFSPDDRWLANDPGFLPRLFEVNTADELRLLWVERGESQASAVCDFSLDGRLFAAAGAGGVHVWSVANGKHLAFLEVKEARVAIFSPAANLLLTVGIGCPDIQQWPFEWVGSDLRIGPPVSLGAQAAITTASMDRAGKNLILVRNGRLCLLDLERRTERLIAGPSVPDPRVVSLGPVATWAEGVPPTTVIYRTACLSPTAKWCAACRHDTNLVQVFETSTAQMLQTLQTTGVMDLAFSPDGHWLVTCGDHEYRFWDTATWQCARVAPIVDFASEYGEIAFSRDGTEVAILGPRQTIRLLDPSNGQEFATLEAYERQKVSYLAFSPDGSHLAVCGWNHPPQLWDLRLIRKELAEMNLDWGLPAKARLPGASSLADRGR